MKPISMINPPSDAERDAIFEEDKGRCGTWRKHIFNLSASVETPRFENTTARILGSGWRLSGIYRANSGAPLTVFTGTDRALSGIQAGTQRANQVLDDPYGDGTVDNWLNPLAFAQPALGTYGDSVRNAYDGPGRQVVDLSLVRSFRLRQRAPDRGARRSVQRLQLVPAGQSEHHAVAARPSGASRHRAIRGSCSLR